MKLIVYFLKGTSLDKLTHFLPIVPIHSLLFNDQLLLIIIEWSFRCFLFVKLQPHPVQLNRSLVFWRECRFNKINFFGHTRQLFEIDLLEFFMRLVTVKFFHKLIIAFSRILDRLLLLNHLRLFPKRVRRIPFKLKVTNNSTSRRVFRLQSVSTYKLIQRLHAQMDSLTNFYINIHLLFNLSWALMFSDNKRFNSFTFYD